MRILVTGGAGFIGSCVIRYLINHTEYEVCNVDKLTYAGNLNSLPGITESERYRFFRIDICDGPALKSIFDSFNPNIVMHLAAESHVDRSIDSSRDFIQTNVFGTFELLEASRAYFARLEPSLQELFRFHHISTDEVYGDLGLSDKLFTEASKYSPSSPYSASKASSDHLVRAWGRTYGLPVVITNCSNNYGPYHFPEKLIPHIILNALRGKPLPIYGDGEQVRDWLFVEDHARALVLVCINGIIGETYNIGGYNEKRNIDVVNEICELLEEMRPDKPKGVSSYHDLIEFVDDRPGHDLRYAISAQKISDDLNWMPTETFESGLRKTVAWYLANHTWWERVLDGTYQLDRLGHLAAKDI